jgi:hypothetical protein
MTDHCQFPHCVVPSEEGCGAGEPDHRECHHWQIGQLRSKCQKTREILMALVGVDNVRDEVPGMLSVLYGVQQSVHPKSDDAASVAVSIRALEFLRDTEPPDGASHG